MTNVIDIKTAFRNGDKLSKPDMKKLYEAAKEAYYNGDPILEDFEFDSLETTLGLENKSYVGTKHNPKYTVKHPFIMGSLSKVQIHKDNDGNINWSQYFTEVNKYICRNIMSHVPCIVTPKFDGCSFEACCSGNLILNVSSRGDSEYGADYYKHLNKLINPNVTALATQINKDYIIRGEVLINKKTFAEKYSDFVNPRSFVSGILNRDYSEDAEFQSMLADLSIVIYDIRIKDELNYTWEDVDWNKYTYPDAPKYYLNTLISSPKALHALYDTFTKYREACEFALDGIVIKPVDIYRGNNLTDHRPKDCVAIKFIPMLDETEIIDIEWNLKKSGNFIPTIITKPVIMDGKSVTRCSGFNYKYLVDNKISIGTKIIMSLAGDIIPYIYKITDNTKYDASKLNIPLDYVTVVDGVHLKAVLDENTKNRLSFIYSVSTLNVPSLGPSAAEKIYEYFDRDATETDDFFGEIKNVQKPSNILMISPEDVYLALGGKSGQNGKKAFEEVLNKISFKDIIKSCNFNACGDKITEQIEKYVLIGKDAADFSHLPEKAYSWIFNNDSDEWNKVNNILQHLGKSIEYFKESQSPILASEDSRIPIIMTGEPNDYASKAEFLHCHPEYRNTTSWKEVQIVFTNDLESNTGKMKKAREKNIEIRIY